MKKLFLILVLTVCIGISNITSTYANYTNKNYIQNNLEKIENKYEFIEFIDLNEKEELKNVKNSQNIKPLLKFNNIEEFEIFLETIKNSKNENNKEINISIDKNNELTKSNVHNGLHTVKNCIPFAGTIVLNGPFCWINADISYQYTYKNNKPYFTNGTGVTSYVTGALNFGNWNQTSYVQNIYDNTLNSRINGYWLLGVEINGLTIGAKVSDSFSWNLNFK